MKWIEDVRGKLINLNSISYIKCGEANRRGPNHPIEYQIRLVSGEHEYVIYSGDKIGRNDRYDQILDAIGKDII